MYSLFNDPDDHNDELDISEVRGALRDYYGTAMTNGFPMAVMDLAKVDSMTDEEVIKDAMKNGILD